VYLPDRHGRPGQLAMVDLDVVEMGPAELVLPEATVRDERGGQLFGGSPLVFDPAAGGGPAAGPAAEVQARAFGVVNAAFHAQRALQYVSALLGHGLPRLTVRIGLHGRWGGGHYRLPAGAGAGEPETLAPAGEVHLGGGAGFLTVPGGGRYFRAPAHNTAIIYHETGHHICRHTADFRLGKLRPPQRQANAKIALDEGTADFLTAVLLGSPDIYGWHRAHLPPSDQRRRMLDPRWTMAHFRGGPGSDPHADGTVWASACWSARTQAAAAGARPARFDAALLRGMDRYGAQARELTEEELRQRRHFARLLAGITGADPPLAPVVADAMARHGIYPGATNAALQEAARTALARQTVRAAARVTARAAGAEGMAGS
jgi:hypothetical protein